MTARDRLAALAAPGLLVVTVTAFYFAALVHPETIQAIDVDGGDVINYFRPHAIDQFRYLRAFGDLALWNDRVAMGAPAIGQFGTYYPPRIAALALASSSGMAADLLTWGHTLIAALATYALLRLYGIGRWPAVLGGQLYALAHLAVRWAPLFHAPAYFAALPLSLLGLELIWRRRARLGMPLLALAIAMTVLGGHLQNAHLLLQTVGVFLVLRLLSDPQPWRARLRPLGASAAGIVLGCLASGPALVSFLVQQSSSTRQHSDIADVAGMTARSVASAFDPVAAMAKSELNADLYLALVAPVLIVLGIVVAVRSRALAPMLVLLALSLLIGFKTPLLNVLMATVPGWEVVSNVARMSFVMTLPLAVLAAAGVDWLVRRAAGEAMAAGAALLVLSAAYWALRTRGEPTTGWIVAAVAVVGAAALAFFALRLSRRVAAAVAVPVALTLVALLGSVQERKLGWEPELDTTPAIAREWIDLVGRVDSDGRWMSYCQELQYPQYRYRPVMFLERRGRWLDTYDSFIAKDYFAYWRALTGSRRWDTVTGGQWDMHTPTDPLPRANLVDAAGIRRILGSDLCDRSVAPLGWRPLLTGGDGFVVYENPGAYPDAYLSRRWEPAASPQAAIDGLSGPRTTFAGHTDFVEGDLTVQPTGAAPAAATVTRDGAERLTVSLAERTTRPELLVLLDHYADGWTARAGEQELEIRRVNGAFRGVVVPAGAERVEFEYAPWSDRVLGPLSLVALALLVVWALVAAALPSWRQTPPA